MTHNYQNTDIHTVNLTIRYDDGYQMKTDNATIDITPIVYDGLVADFTWDITPKGREDVVTFSDASTDIDTRFISYSWTINDHYNKWNPDNVDYGVSTTDNTQTISHDTTVDLTPTHNFQDNTDEIVEMTYWYDDGYCEQSVSKSQTITKDKYVIIPQIKWDVETIGKTDVIWNNDSTGDTSRELDEKWEWNDIKLDNTDEWTLRDDQTVRADQPFTWLYPSRKPYCVVDGATASNPNKEVKLEVRIDTGWRDDTDDGTIGDDNSNGNGGQVYWTVNSIHEAVTKEINSNITYEENIEGYTH